VSTVADENFGQKLLAELALFFDPIVKTGGSPRLIIDLFEFVGWDLKTLLGPNSGPFVTQMGAIATAVDTIEQNVSHPPQTFQEVASALSAVGDVVDAVAQLPDTLSGVQPAGWDELPADLIEQLLLLYLARRARLVFEALRLLTIIRERTVAEVVSNNVVVRAGRKRASLELDRIPKLLSKPLDELKAEYMPNGLATRSDANAAGQLILSRVGALLAAVGVEPFFGAGEGAPTLSTEFEEMLAGMVRLQRRFLVAEGTTVTAGANLALVSEADGGPGLALMPFGELAVTVPFAGWDFTLQADTEIGGAVIRKGGVDFIGPGIAARLDLALRAAKRPLPSGAAVLLGSTKGTHLAIGALAISGEAHIGAQVRDFGFLLEVDRAAVVIKPGDGDGFLAKILPPDGIETDFDLAFGWSNTKGVYFRGSVGIAVTLPIHKSLFEVITIDSIYIAIKLASTGELNLVLAITGSAKLGPISASVERIGLKATVDFPPAGGNLGPANMEQFGFKLPDGAGLSIKAGPVGGGGYIFIDEEKGLYAGILQLKFQMIGLTAIGLLNTKMPDGSKGFSLLIVITAKFPPIQLGYGFVLTGAGGILGVNRTVAVDALRAGVKNKTLDALMFPADPVRDAPQIISGLSAAFPPAEGHFIFGPMVELGWGSPPIITVVIGIALELPSPIRLIILGKVQIALPEAKDAVLLLKMEILGIIDFDRGEASLDATLQDSKVACFPITGDIAMRANWASSPTFMFSAGGYHPRFTPPPNFPKLDRLAISLAMGDNPRLRLEAYFAITSNTAQVGAHLDAFASADLGKIIGKFTVAAWFSFDALFQFVPFAMIAELHAGATLKRNGDNLFNVTLDITLTGPEPWHAWGQATFELMGKHSIAFDKTIGDAPPPRELPTVDLLPDLLAAVKNKDNWSAQLPSASSMLISLGQITSQNALAHPLGTIGFHQRIVPLNVEISKVGNAAPAGARRFTVAVTLGGAAPHPSATPLKDQFAAAQFFEMSDDEKRARPSFELMDAGLEFGAGALAHSSAVSTTTLDYETSIVDVQLRTVDRLGTPYRIDVETAFALAGAGAAAYAPAGSTGAARFAGEPIGVSVSNPSWSLASKDDLTGIAGGEDVSYTEALSRGRATAGHAQVVRSTEVVG
jgi:hypothetical protein